MTKSKHIFICNLETGEKMKILDSDTVIDWCNDDTHAVDIINLYHFECDVNWPLINQAAKDLYLGSSAWKTGCRLADELNNLIEEYHAPGNTRRERRAIKRQFNKTFRIFHKHCKECNMLYSFKRPNK